MSVTCPKCKKGTVIAITKQAPPTVSESRELWKIMAWIFLFPVMAIWWCCRVLFKPRKQEYGKTPYWHCSYCNHDWPQELEQEQEKKPE